MEKKLTDLDIKILVSLANEEEGKCTLRVTDNIKCEDCLLSKFNLIDFEMETKSCRERSRYLIKKLILNEEIHRRTS